MKIVSQICNPSELGKFHGNVWNALGLCSLHLLSKSELLSDSIRKSQIGGIVLLISQLSIVYTMKAQVLNLALLREILLYVLKLYERSR